MKIYLNVSIEITSNEWNKSKCYAKKEKLYWCKFQENFCIPVQKYSFYFRSGTKSATFWKQFKLNFFGSIWVIETQKNWFREKNFKNKESTGGVLIFWTIFNVMEVNCSKKCYGWARKSVQYSFPAQIIPRNSFLQSKLG